LNVLANTAVVYLNVTVRIYKIRLITQNSRSVVSEVTKN
jgi:hypothetical protein